MLVVQPPDEFRCERFETCPAFVESLNVSRYLKKGGPSDVLNLGRYGHKSFKIEGFEEVFVLGKDRQRSINSFESRSYGYSQSGNGDLSGTNNLDCIQELWDLACKAYTTGSLISVKGVIEVHTEKPSEEAVRAAMARAAAGHSVTIPAAKVTRDLVVTDITISRPKRGGGGGGGGSGDKGGAGGGGGGGASGASDADPW